MRRQTTNLLNCRFRQFNYRMSAAQWFGLVILLCSFNVLQAADIARDVRAGREDETLLFDGYLEFSASASRVQIPIDGVDDYIGKFGVGGHIRYRRFFIDVFAESYNQFQTGLNILSDDVWSVDLLGASSEHGVDSELNRELQLFSDRNPAFFLGFRATAYRPNYILQFEALNDVSRVHNGSLITATIAKTWLYHNWNFHALIGGRYESPATLDYQFGNSPEDATENYPAYKARAGTTFVSELGVTYPLNEHFIFNATGRWWKLPPAIIDSPFINSDLYLTATGTITFVY